MDINLFKDSIHLRLHMEFGNILVTLEISIFEIHCCAKINCAKSKYFGFLLYTVSNNFNTII